MPLKADDDHLRPVSSDQQPTHVATGRKLLDAKPLSADSRAHPAACMAPHMMEKAETRREGNGVQPAGADVEQRQHEQRQPPPAVIAAGRGARPAQSAGQLVLPQIAAQHFQPAIRGQLLAHERDQG